MHVHLKSTYDQWNENAATVCQLIWSSIQTLIKIKPLTSLLYYCKKNTATTSVLIERILIVVLMISPIYWCLASSWKIYKEGMTRKLQHLDDFSKYRSGNCLFGSSAVLLVILNDWMITTVPYCTLSHITHQNWTKTTNRNVTHYCIHDQCVWMQAQLLLDDLLVSKFIMRISSTISNIHRTIQCDWSTIDGKMSVL